MESVKQWLEAESLSDLPGLECLQLTIPRGVLLPSEKLAFFSEYELYSSPRRLSSGRKTASEEPETFTSKINVRDAVDETLTYDLEDGDYAVHVNYGVCLYKPLRYY